ncbi:hypothetical protein B6U96_17340 [Archaeoglobales archaeon ex4484_92]|nr:MAG: hypothetical protein B6U96_17340 [Archaeoglobales archaeon ex4484_92]
MGYVVIKSGEKIEIIEEEDFSADKKEEYLHKLIEENPQIILKEIIEKEVITLASHLKLPSGGELDLLLVDSSGNLIVVELKKGKGHREAIAQLLDYASDLQQMNESELFNSTGVKFQSLEELFKNFYADEEEFTYDEFRRNFLESIADPNKVQLLLVSYAVGEDTLKLAEWLRKFGVRIFCVEFEYFRSENKEIFVPKLLSSVGESRKIETKTLTETQEKYLRFFSEILSKFKEIKPGVTEKRATADNWLKIPAGFSSIHFEWLFRGREPNKVLEVGLHFEHTDEDTNQKLLDYFRPRESTLKEKLGELEFGKFGRRWRKIYVEKEVGSLDNAIQSEEIKEWAVESMKQFYEVFKESGEIERAVRAVREI